MSKRCFTVLYIYLFYYLRVVTSYLTRVVFRTESKLERRKVLKVSGTELDVTVTNNITHSKHLILLMLLEIN